VVVVAAEADSSHVTHDVLSPVSAQNAAGDARFDLFLGRPRLKRSQSLAHVLRVRVGIKRRRDSLEMGEATPSRPPATSRRTLVSIRRGTMTRSEPDRPVKAPSSCLRRGRAISLIFHLLGPLCMATSPFTATARRDCARPSDARCPGAANAHSAPPPHPSFAGAHHTAQQLVYAVRRAGVGGAREGRRLVKKFEGWWPSRLALLDRSLSLNERSAPRYGTYLALRTSSAARGSEVRIPVVAVYAWLTADRGFVFGDQRHH
jgi:hypothetical protein